MPTLAKIPGKLTIGEAIERLKNNPDDPDPELQEFKKSSERLAKYLFESHQSQLSILTTSISSALENVISVGDLFRDALIPVNSFAQVFSEVAESQRRMIEMIRLPNYLFESLKALSEQINELYEPARLLSQSFALYKTPILFNELSRINTNWVVPGYITVNEGETITPMAYKETLVEEKKVFAKELVVLEESEQKIVSLPYYYYRTSKTLLLCVTTVAAIPLYSKSGNSDIEAFVETLLNFLEEKGTVVGEFKQVFVPVSELIRQLISRTRHVVNMEWIKTTRSNFMNHKVPSFLQDIISISDFDRKNQGYYFRIRVKIPIPKRLT